MAKRRGIDSVTKGHIRNAADERAARNGCRFDPERAKWAVDWIERYCYLYEGEYAGTAMKLRDWQRIATEHIFGWVHHSDDWGREVRRFRRASIWVPKKNKKSPTLAAFGLYLLCGDGEEGQKVFSTAKDGKQAMIAHTHAIEMVRRSPELSLECTINRATGRITHEPTRSFYSVIAGDNIEGQEGLNGSILVDETHVVDRRLMSVLRGAGISRSEPLQAEFSTAGNNPDGYGRSQWEYGRRVQSGEVTDEELFYLDYSAQQDISDAELDRDILKIGEAANPAWGHTVKPSEFLSHYQTAKVSQSDLADFKMYRLNIWQKSTSPFIRASDWEACREDFTPEDLLGQRCYAGLDLSKTRDMSSLSLVFPCGEFGESRYRVLPFFWMPEAEARAKNHLAGFMEWARNGWLTLTPDEVIDYGFIRSAFRDMAKKYDIRGLAYDRVYADDTTQALSEGVRAADGTTIEEGTGVPRVEFRQTMTEFAGPTAEFERSILAKRLGHNGHPVLSWQVGHVQVRTDANNNKRPVKSSKDDVRKIDGVVATIMAIGLLLANPDDGASVYEGRGLLTV